MLFLCFFESVIAVGLLGCICFEFLSEFVLALLTPLLSELVWS